MIQGMIGRSTVSDGFGGFTVSRNAKTFPCDLYTIPMIGFPLLSGKPSYLWLLKGVLSGTFSADPNEPN